MTSTTGETMTGAELAARQVKRGESVRIVGLGSLSAVPYGDIRKDPPRDSYRLTLTAAVWQATSKANGVDAPGTDIRRDVTHLARALCAPIEVYAGTSLVTVVRP